MLFKPHFRQSPNQEWGSSDAFTEVEARRLDAYLMEHSFAVLFYWSEHEQSSDEKYNQNALDVLQSFVTEIDNNFGRDHLERIPYNSAFKSIVKNQLAERDVP